CRLKVPNSFEQNMKSEFGEFVALFSANEFISQIGKISKEENIYIQHGKVEYLDYSTNPQKRVNAFIENKAEFYFQKNIYFEGQDEYRFIFPTFVSQEGIKLDLKTKVELVDEITNFSELLNAEYGLKIMFNH